MKNDRIQMTVTMDVTVPQALTLQAMFEYWNHLAAIGSSRKVSFFVDGDGNFKPKCSITTSESIPELTPVIRDKSVADDNGYGELVFDFDCVSWFVNHPELYDIDGCYKGRPPTLDEQSGAV